MRLAPRILTSLLLCLVLGLHWSVLQVAGWTTMFLERVQTESWEAALAKTLDGQHPCKVCHWVKEGRAEEQRRQGASPTLPAPTPKLELWAGPGWEVPDREVEGWESAFPPTVNPGARSESPGLRPPRRA